jgi:hypothetical protein
MQGRGLVCADDAKVADDLGELPAEHFISDHNHAN